MAPALAVKRTRSLRYANNWPTVSMQLAMCAAFLGLLGCFGVLLGQQAAHQVSIQEVKRALAAEHLVLEAEAELFELKQILRAEQASQTRQDALHQTLSRYCAALAKLQALPADFWRYSESEKALQVMLQAASRLAGLLPDVGPRRQSALQLGLAEASILARLAEARQQTLQLRTDLEDAQAESTWKQERCIQSIQQATLTAAALTALLAACLYGLHRRSKAQLGLVSKELETKDTELRKRSLALDASRARLQDQVHAAAQSARAAEALRQLKGYWLTHWEALVRSPVEGMRELLGRISSKNVPDDTALPQYSERMLAFGESVSSAIDNFVLLLRLQAGWETYSPRLTDLHTLCENMVEELESRLARKNQTVVVTPRTVRTTTNVDPEKLRMVLLRQLTLMLDDAPAHARLEVLIDHCAVYTTFGELGHVCVTLQCPCAAASSSCESSCATCASGQCSARPQPLLAEGLVVAPCGSSASACGTAGRPENPDPPGCKCAPAHTDPARTLNRQIGTTICGEVLKLHGGRFLADTAGGSCRVHFGLPCV